MASLIPWRRNRGRSTDLTHRGAHPLDVWRQSFDTLFDRFFGGMLAPFEEDFESTRFWDLDVDERDNEVRVRADLPGFDENEIDVQVNDNFLTIRAEKRETGDGEQSYRSYRRTVMLPSGINAEQAQANYRNGVLELHLPKREEARGRRIPISQSTGTQAIGQTTGGTPGATGTHAQSAQEPTETGKRGKSK